MTYMYRSIDSSVCHTLCGRVVVQGVRCVPSDNYYTVSYNTLYSDNQIIQQVQ